MVILALSQNGAQGVKGLGAGWVEYIECHQFDLLLRWWDSLELGPPYRLQFSDRPLELDHHSLGDDVFVKRTQRSLSAAEYVWSATGRPASVIDAASFSVWSNTTAGVSGTPSTANVRLSRRGNCFIASTLDRRQNARVSPRCGRHP